MKKENACHHAIVDSINNSDSIEMHKMCISIVPIFNHLELDEMNEIVKSTKSITLKRGETLYNAGDPANSLYIVHKGRIKIYRLSELGKEQLIRILEPGQFTGELNLFTESFHDSYAEALKKAEICMMARKDLEGFLLKYPSVSLKILHEFSQRLASTELQATRFATEDVERRLALYLAEMTEKQKSSVVKLPITRKDLASYLGTTPETLSRRLARFEDAGWIKQQGQLTIQIVDLDELLLI